MFVQTLYQKHIKASCGQNIIQCPVYYPNSNALGCLENTRLHCFFPVCLVHICHFFSALFLSVSLLTQQNIVHTPPSFLLEPQRFSPGPRTSSILGRQCAAELLPWPGTSLVMDMGFFVFCCRAGIKTRDICMLVTCFAHYTISPFLLC